MSTKIGLARVRGHSMVPTLVPGDRVLIRYGAFVGTGDVIIFEREGKVDIKRIDRIEQDGIYVLGDNEYMSLDSRTYGLVQPNHVLGKAVARVWPHPGKLQSPKAN